MGASSDVIMRLHACGYSMSILCALWAYGSSCSCRQEEMSYGEISRQTLPPFFVKKPELSGDHPWFQAVRSYYRIMALTHSALYKPAAGLAVVWRRFILKA